MTDHPLALFALALAVLALLALLFKPALVAGAPDDAVKPVLPVLFDRSGGLIRRRESGQRQVDQVADLIGQARPAA